MNRFLETLFIICFGAVLAACGGSDSSDNNRPYVEPRKSYPNEVQPENSVLPTPEDMAPFVGVFDASDTSLNKGDEIYYTINRKGILRVYDYQNDAVDSAGNCYAPATRRPIKANYDLEGRQFYWDETGQRLVMTYRGKLLAINLDENGTPVSMTFKFSTTNITYRGGGEPGYPDPILLILRLVPLSGSPTMSDLKNSSC